MYPNGSYRYLLSFGSNLGTRQKNCKQGISLLKKNVQIINLSSFIETDPLRSLHYDTKDHDVYLNGIVEIKSHLLPDELYNKVIKPIEDKIGHSRLRKWAPRELDIDILFWAKNDALRFEACSPCFYQEGGSKQNPLHLQVPHSELKQRAFLFEILAGMKLDGKLLRQRHRIE